MTARSAFFSGGPRSRYALGAVLFAVAMAAPAGRSAETFEPLTLANDRAEVTVLPGLGGRIVGFARAGTGRNWLNHPPATRPADAAEGAAPSYFHWGHTVWLAPQAEWYPPMADGRPRLWPPDPALDTRPYAVLRRAPDRVTLQSPPSAAAGVRLVKELRLDADGALWLDVEVVNLSDRPRRWAVWSNTRFPPRARAYAPVDPAEPLWNTLGVKRARKRSMQPVWMDGEWAGLDPAPPSEGTGTRMGKLSLMPLFPVIVVELDGEWLEKRAAEKAAPREVPSGHGAVELFQRLSLPDDPEREVVDYLEAEFVSAEQTLPPGKSLRWGECWRILDDRPDPGETVSAWLRRRYAGEYPAPAPSR